MGWKAMENLRELLCKELEEYKSKDKLGMSDLEIVNKITDTIKNIDKIEMLEEDGGYSEDDGMYSQRKYNRTGYARDNDWEARGTYDRGNSYANRHWVRGHYSRGDGMMRDDNYSARRYSRDDAKMEIVAQIEDMMQDAGGQMRDILNKAKMEIERA